MRFLRGIFLSLLVTFFNRFRWNFLRNLKVEAVRTYVKGIKVARQSVLLISLFLVALVLLTVGIGMFLTAIFLFLPWSVEAKALALLISGVIIMGFPITMLIMITSEKLWLETFRVEDVLHRLK